MSMQDDARLTEQVRQVLVPYKFVSIFVDDGTVRISGTVADEGERQTVLTAVRAVPGVLKVKDDMHTED